MIEYIREAQATYVTNALSHAKRLADKGFHVILIGGGAKSSTDAIVGAEAVVNLQKYHFSKGFFRDERRRTKRRLYDAGREGSDGQADCGEKYAARKPLFPLATSSKFGKVYAVTFAGFEGGVILTEALVQESLPKSVRVVNVNQPEQ